MAGAPHSGTQPHPAPVSPRVRLRPFEASLPIEKQVEALLAKKTRGAVNLVGPPGSGKTMAMEHLAAKLDPDAPVCFADGRDPQMRPPTGKCLVLVPSREPLDQKHLVTLEMSPWTDEDLIEYLLATHPGRCRAVMDKIRNDPIRASLRGLPELWRIVLDEMAADDEVAGVEAALSSVLFRHLSDPQMRDAAERQCLFALAPWGITRPIPHYTLEPKLDRIVRHQPVRMMLAARRLTQGLRDGTAWDELKGKLPDDLIEHCGLHVRLYPAAQDTLESMLGGQDDQVHAMAASILHAACASWRPGGQNTLNLCDAKLSYVQWSNVDLSGSHLRRADLRHATLARANLTRADLTSASLNQAMLADLKAANVVLRRASLRAANLSGASLYLANLAGADLTEATLDGASLRNAVLRHAVLRQCSLRSAELTEADLSEARVEGADFTGANLSRAILSELPLRGATISDACFREAFLFKCDLEGIEGTADFTLAKLENALLTGSILHGSNFSSADLRQCGLADIDWEGADLRDADLRGATFHMGSTRSGLVGSDVPCEGSRTDFYTDDYYDRELKDTHEVRKANLCGADLRGANIENVDFYLVDLRGAKYTTSQAEWLVKCRAIL